jgi:hypothetical protein
MKRYSRQLFGGWCRCLTSNLGRDRAQAHIEGQAISYRRLAIVIISFLN